MMNYKTIDFFASIGGMRLGFENTGHFTNVFGVENDKFACQTYLENFNENPMGYIKAIDDRQTYINQGIQEAAKP